MVVLYYIRGRSEVSSCLFRTFPANATCRRRLPRWVMRTSSRDRPSNRLQRKASPGKVGVAMCVGGCLRGLQVFFFYFVSLCFITVRFVRLELLLTQFFFVSCGNGATCYAKLHFSITYRGCRSELIGWVDWMRDDRLTDGVFFFFSFSRRMSFFAEEEMSQNFNWLRAIDKLQG